MLNHGVGELRAILIDNTNILDKYTIVLSTENNQNISASSAQVSIVGILRACGAVLSMLKHC